MPLPSDFFRPVLAACRLEKLNDDASLEELKERIVTNFRVNFLNLFLPENHDPFSFPVTLNSSESFVDKISDIIDPIHQDYMESVSNRRLFDFYLEEDDEAVVDDFRRGEAVLFFSTTLKLYLAHILENNLCSEDKIKTQYKYFLSNADHSQCRSADDFWDSKALYLYSSHLAYQKQADLLIQEPVSDEVQSNLQADVTSETSLLKHAQRRPS